MVWLDNSTRGALIDSQVLAIGHREVPTLNSSGDKVGSATAVDVRVRCGFPSECARGARRRFGSHLLPVLRACDQAQMLAMNIGAEYVTMLGKLSEFYAASAKAAGRDAADDFAGLAAGDAASTASTHVDDNAGRSRAEGTGVTKVSVLCRLTQCCVG